MWELGVPHLMSWQLNVAKGLCTCGRQRREGKAKCAYCARAAKARYRANREVRLAQSSRQWEAIKKEVIEHYGGTCACCGEDWIGFLCLDHIDGGGTQHRAEILKETGNKSLHHWLKRHNFPEGFQVLCANCNMAKGSKNKKCIHQLRREREREVNKLSCAGSSGM